MTWAITSTVATVGSSLVGGYLSSKSSKDASRAQQDAAKLGIESEERMFERGLELQAPYREAGYNALSGLEGLATDQGRAQSLQDYYGGAEYAAQAGQATKTALTSASQTGGLRSGNTYQALEGIAPQLGQNYLSNQYNQLTGIANLGAGAASQGASGAQYLGSSIGGYQSQIGQAQAQNELAQGQVYNQTLGTLAGLF